jgi:hypothetical protein
MAVHNGMAERIANLSGCRMPRGQMNFMQSLLIGRSQGRGE